MITNYVLKAPDPRLKMGLLITGTVVATAGVVMLWFTAEEDPNKMEVISTPKTTTETFNASKYTSQPVPLKEDKKQRKKKND